MGGGWGARPKLKWARAPIGQVGSAPPPSPQEAKGRVVILMALEEIQLREMLASSQTTGSTIWTPSAGWVLEGILPKWGGRCQTGLRPTCSLRPAGHRQMVILVKNLQASTLVAELQETFGRLGSLGQVLLPEGGVTGHRGVPGGA